MIKNFYEAIKAIESELQNIYNEYDVSDWDKYFLDLEIQRILSRVELVTKKK